MVVEPGEDPEKVCESDNMELMKVSKFEELDRLKNMIKKFGSHLENFYYYKRNDEKSKCKKYLVHMQDSEIVEIQLCKPISILYNAVCQKKFYCPICEPNVDLPSSKFDVWQVVCYVIIGVASFQLIFFGVAWFRSPPVVRVRTHI